MEGNVQDGNQQPRAERREQQLLGVGDVCRGRAGGCGGAGGASEGGMGTKGACWNLHSSEDNGEVEEEEEEGSCVSSLLHI